VRLNLGMLLKPVGKLAKFQLEVDQEASFLNKKTGNNFINLKYEFINVQKLS